MNKIMKQYLYLTIFLLISGFTTPAFAEVSGKESSVLSLVSSGDDSLKNADNKILIISTRNFTDPETLTIDKGVHPENERFFFVVGTKADSIIVVHYESLEKAMSQLDKNRNLLVYVNGYNKTFEGTIKGGQMLSARYNVNAIMFDWPTDQKPIRITAKNARKVSNNLAVSLNEVGQVQQNISPGTNLSVVFHSMGNHVARHLVKSGNINHVKPGVVDNIILNAAAVKSYDHNRWVEKMNNDEKVYIVVNKYDYVLRGASLMRGVRQLGNVPLGEMADNAHYIDFSEIAEKEHSYYLGETIAEKKTIQFFEFYNAVFQGLTFGNNKNEFLVAN